MKGEHGDCCGSCKPVVEVKSCCGGHSHHGEVVPGSSAKYFCPMCPGVESDQPGDCPKCGMALERNPAWHPARKTIYTCPMHPEVEQDHPGDCPKCGMALEPKSVAGADDEAGDEAAALLRKLWISAGLAFPVFLLAMGEMSFPGKWPVNPTASGWIQFALSSAAVLWTGGFIFAKAWRSLLHGSLNMFTLIALGVGAAWLYSASEMLLPGLFPHSLRHGDGAQQRVRDRQRAAAPEQGVEVRAAGRIFGVAARQTSVAVMRESH